MSASESLDAVASFSISGKDSAPLVSSEDSSILALGQGKSPTTDNETLEKAVYLIHDSKTDTKQTILQENAKRNLSSVAHQSEAVNQSVPSDSAVYLPQQDVQKIPLQDTQKIHSRNMPLQDSRKMIPQAAQKVPLQAAQKVPLQATQKVPLHDAHKMHLQNAQMVHLQGGQNVHQLQGTRDRVETVPSADFPTVPSGDHTAKAPFYPHGKSRPEMFIDIDLSSDTSDAGITNAESAKSLSLSSMMMMTPLLSPQNTADFSDGPPAAQKDESSLVLFTNTSSEIDLESISLSKPLETRPPPTTKPKTHKKVAKEVSAPAAATESESSCCRICQEGKSQESLISPCYCSGTMGKVHLSCMETWLSLMHRSSCELCQYEFPVERITQPTYKFFLNPGSSTEFANLMCDITCFLILTPLLILTMFLCTRGVKYYDAHGKTGSMFAVVTLIGSLLVVYVSWAVLAFLYHYRIWRTWRKNTAIIRMSLYKNPKTDAKAMKKVSKIAKLFDLKRVQRGNEGTQTERVGGNIPAEPAAPRQEALNNESPDSVSREQALGNSMGNSRSRLTERTPGENSRGCFVGFKPMNKTKCQISVVVRDGPASASRAASGPANCPSCNRRASSRSRGNSSKQPTRSRFADVSSNATDSPCESRTGKSLKPATNEGQFTNNSSACVFTKKNIGKGIRKTLVKVHGLQPKNDENSSRNDENVDKALTAKGSHRQKKDKTGYSGSTVSFQIEPSNPAQLVGFRFLDK